MNVLWYRKPAVEWSEALPLGNGRIGAMVFGQPGHEVIQLNEESVWSGPFRDRNNRSCRAALPEIRRLLDSGHIQEAQELAYESMTGCPSQQSVYQTAGELHIDFFTQDNKGLKGPCGVREDLFNCSVYKRSLDLESAIATTSFTAESSMPSTAYFSKNTHGSSITYTREVFASAADDVLVVHIAASTPKSIFFRANFDRGDFAHRMYALEEDTIVMECNSGIPFSAVATVLASGGRVSTKGGTLLVEGADEATLYVDIETAFRGHRFSAKKGNASLSREKLAMLCTDEALRKVCFASSTSYTNLKAGHLAEYCPLYGRVKLCLGGPGDASAEGSVDSGLVPTDELLSGRADNPKLAELYWNYGRYLLLASSRRPGTLPATLQGLWNKEMDPKWGSRYTININTQMNYWAAAMCSLPETEMPLFSLMKRAYKNGRKTARVMYGCDGYVAHHSLDIWGDTAPQGQWIPGTYWVLGAAWLATHVREHYEYTLDLKFLRKHYYLLREACEFFSQYLVPSANGRHLVLSPSVSPENSYRLPNGESGSFCSGADMDNRILEHLFRATIDSARDLGYKDDSSELLHLRSVLDRIEEPVVTAGGTVREWALDCEETEKGHRHISQLYGLFPGHSINYNRTPELAEAAARTIDSRLANGGGNTGWSRAWIMNFYASLHEGAKAGESLAELLRNYTLPNLLDNNPPFQIDGNFGALCAMTRMIVQSECVDGGVEVELLPALPASWKNGSLSGVSVKGNLKLDVEWADGRISKARLYALPGTRYCGRVTLIYGRKRYEAPLTDGSVDLLNVLPSTI